MPARPTHSKFALSIIILILAVLIGPLIWWANDAATGTISSDHFRFMLDGETSKGLKFVGHFAPLERVGLLGMHTDSFHGTDGLKTIVAMDATDISGVFNPLGIGLRRWQVDDIHIKSGTVHLQTTNFPPTKAPGIPWWALFWPYRVHLEDLKCDEANVLFNIQDKEAGIYKTFLEITPNGHDFEYDAKGGTFKLPMTPSLDVQHIHLLIRRPRLYCPELILGDDPAHPDQQIRIEGDAGLQEDRSIKLSIDAHAIDIGPWFPDSMKDHVLGVAEGHLNYHSTGPGLETAEGNGHLSVTDGVLRDLPQIREYIKLTQSPDPGDVVLTKCEMDFKMHQGAMTVENINIESEGLFHLQGSVTLSKDKNLSGQLELGFTSPYLQWLPNARTDIFNLSDGQYHAANIFVSGTMQHPHQDLTERIIKEIESSPLTAAKLFFNQIGSLFESN